VWPDVAKYLAPADGTVLVSTPYDDKRLLPLGYPPFSPVVYPLDRLLPAVNLGQASAYRPWAPEGCGLEPWRFGWFLVFFDWVLIACGWILTTLLVGSLTGLMRRVDSDD
jgi:hypothetical protein